MPNTIQRRWITVISSNLYKISYDGHTRVLSIVFINRKNAVYNYKDVPGTVYISLINSVSKGKYFARNIKDTYGFYIGTYHLDNRERTPFVSQKVLNNQLQQKEKRTVPQVIKEKKRFPFGGGRMLR